MSDNDPTPTTTPPPAAAPLEPVVLPAELDRRHDAWRASLAWLAARAQTSKSSARRLRAMLARRESERDVFRRVFAEHGGPPPRTCDDGGSCGPGPWLHGGGGVALFLIGVGLGQRRGAER